MSEKEKKEKISLTSFDPVETPEEIINSDKDTNRKEAFKETYRRIASIIPEYFMTQRKKRKNASSGGGTSFTQNIIVTPEKATVQRTEVEHIEKEKENEKEIGD